MLSRASVPHTDRPIRVLYIEANEDGSVGGSHQVLYDMVSALDRSLYEPFVVFYQNNRFTEAFRSIDVTVLVLDEARAREQAIRESGRWGTKTVAALRSLFGRRTFLKEHGVDLVHMNNSPRSGRTDWLPAARLAGIPIVASARGDARPLPGTGLRPAVHRWLTTRFDRVIAITDYMAEAWRAQGVPPTRIVTVHDGVNFTTVDSPQRRSREEVRQDLNVPPDRLLVAMVGNVRQWKGQHVVLDALHRLDPSVRSELFVAFVGAIRDEDQEYFDGLQNSVAKWGLGDAVSFVGSRTDVHDIFAAADIAVHSSVEPEPGGMVILEAMSNGTPVICANQGGPLEFVEPGTGLTHDAKDPPQLAAHLTTLTRDPTLRARIAERARARAREFSIERTARRMEAVYDDLLMSRR